MQKEAALLSVEGGSAAARRGALRCLRSPRWNRVNLVCVTQLDRGSKKTFADIDLLKMLCHDDRIKMPNNSLIL